MRNNYSVDTAWFVARLRSKRLSVRKIAILVGIDASSMSRVIRGRQPLRIEQATKVARLLEVSLYELLRRAGTEPPAEGMTLPLVGSLNGALDITIGKHPPVASMPIFEQSAVGLICDDSSSSFYGWIFAYVPAAAIQPSAIGRLSVVHLKGGRMFIRFLKPGLHSDRFDLVPLSGHTLRDVDDVCSASPVLHIRTAQTA